MARLLTIQELRTLAPYSASGEAEALLTLDAVCEAFESYTRRDWLREVEKSYNLRPNAGGDVNIIFPKLYPIEEIHTFQENDANETPADIAETAYDADLTAGVIERVDGNNFKRNVTLVITGGYAVADIPKDVKQGIGIEVRRRLERDKPGTISINSEAVANSGSTQLVPQEQWHPEFRRVCNRYRRLGI